jgi:phage tail-like protein
MADTGCRKDTFRAYNFLLELNGVTAAEFAEVSGLDTETDIIEYRNGSDITVRKPTGLRKSTNAIVLKNGVTHGQELWEWLMKAIDGHPERRSGAVVLLDQDNEEALRVGFRDGWPSKWIGTTINAEGNTVAIDTIEISVEHIERQT